MTLCSCLRVLRPRCSNFKPNLIFFTPAFKTIDQLSENQLKPHLNVLFITFIHMSTHYDLTACHSLHHRTRNTVAQLVSTHVFLFSWENLFTIHNELNVQKTTNFHFAPAVDSICMALRVVLECASVKQLPFINAM